MRHEHTFVKKEKLIWFLVLLAFITIIVQYQALAFGEDPKPRYQRNDIIFMTASEIAEKIRNRELSSVQVIEAFLKQIEIFNPKLNAIVTLNAENARRRAKEADEAISKGELWGPLHGVPVTIKDNYATAGIRSTSSHPPLKDFVPEKDATVVAHLLNAGAIILGKTNLPELGMDFQTNSPIFGITNNPWNTDYSPGGSSGGSAAAVAAGFTPLALGNDLGGSIRIPSHYCGIFGLKPTEHMVSGYGVSPGLPPKKFHSIRHLVSFGPLARSVDDLKLCLKIIGGSDQKVIDVPDFPLIESDVKKINNLKIAWTDDFNGVPVSSETRSALKFFVDRLSKAGCSTTKTVPTDFDFNEAWKTYGKIVDMEFFVHVPFFKRFMMYLFGRKIRNEVPSFEMVYPITYEKYMGTLTKRDMLIGSMERFLSQWDVFICPVSTTSALKHIPISNRIGYIPIYEEDVMVDDRSLNYWVAMGSYTTIFNLTGNPVVVMPIGYTKKGMPIGVQVVARRWHDMELLSIVDQLAKTAGSYRPPKGYKRAQEY